MRDYEREVLERMQVVRSHEIEILQLTDLLTGSIAYENHNLDASTSKSDLAARMRNNVSDFLIATGVPNSEFNSANA